MIEHQKGRSQFIQNQTILKERLTDMITIAVTGGIGAGKSTVTDYLISKGYTVIDADKMLLSEDFLFNIIKTLYARFPQKMTKALLNGRIRNIVLS